MSAEIDRTWEALSERLRGFIACGVGEADAVDDILQEVLLRIHRGGDTLERAEQVHAWVYRIARNAIVDHYRARGRQVALAAALADAAPPEGSDASTDDPRAELAACLAPMLERLPAGYREALALTEVEGLTQQAAATRLGLSLPGAKARVQRARRCLRGMLLDCCRVELDRRGGIVAYEVRDDRGGREGACHGCHAGDTCHTHRWIGEHPHSG